MADNRKLHTESNAHNSQKKDSLKLSFFRESAGARTRDPNIKSVVLYLLSYGFIVPNRSISVFGGANVDNIFIIAKFILLLLLFSLANAVQRAHKCLILGNSTNGKHYRNNSNNRHQRS